MFYILIEFANQGNPILAYQEVWQGYVQRYTDLDGNTMIEPPGGSRVIDDNPPQPSWALPDPAPPPPPPPPVRYVAADALLDRLTEAELLAVIQASKSAAPEQAYVGALLLRLQLARAVKLGEATAISAGLEQLESDGVLVGGRAAEILAVPEAECSIDPPPILG